MKLRFLIIFLLINAIALSAQVQPPTLICIKGDSLIFQAPNNSCGVFNAYEVYGSQNRTGPYTQLGTINDEIATIFVHQEANNDLWYYYLQSDFECPGETAITSDTLDNDIPEPSFLSSVSVENDIIFITWQPSPSIQTFGYVIYRLTDIGTVPIDTVLFNTSYVDIFAKPNEQSEVYFVVALDRCGNASEFVESQRSIFLTSSISDCEQAIFLEWNPYENWLGGVETYEIWISIDGEPAIQVDAIEGTQTTYTLADIEDNAVYEIFVNAVEGGTGIEAKSNRVSVITDIVNPVRNLLLKNATFDENNEVTIVWDWDEQAELSNVSLLSSLDNQLYEVIGMPNFASPLPNPASFSVGGEQADAGKVFYQLMTTDQCDTSVTSNYVSTIFLQGTSLPTQENALNWTAYDSKIGNVSAYSIFRLVDDIPLLVDRVDGGQLTFSDPISNAIDAAACYYIEATVTIPFTQSGVEQITVRSNTICLEPSPKIVMPNAFAPNGRNSIFKPTILFPAGIQDFSMNIYNRYGGLVFESQDFQAGWDGRKDGKEVPQGTYTYQIRIEQTDGEIVEEVGILVLLR